jgi:hypothetical protein
MVSLDVTGVHVIPKSKRHHCDTIRESAHYSVAYVCWNEVCKQARGIVCKYQWKGFKTRRSLTHPSRVSPPSSTGLVKFRKAWVELSVEGEASRAEGMGVGGDSSTVLMGIVHSEGWLPASP